MSIRRHSQHLDGVLTQYFSAEEISLIEAAWQNALLNGGLLEIDYARKPEASYNPRPCRIALILIEDLNVRSASTIASGILFTVFRGLDATGLQTELAPPQRLLIDLAAKGPKALQEKLPHGGENIKQAAAILLADWLDRIRHLHLATDKSVTARWPEFLKENLLYRQLSSDINENFERKLAHWERRFKIRLEKII